MEQFDKMVREMAEKEEMSMPNGFDERLQGTLDSLPPKRKTRPGTVRMVLIAAALCGLLAGAAFAAQQIFGSRIVNVEHDGAYYTQEAYSDIKRFTAADFGENILWSPEGEGFWYVYLDDWDEMEEYLGYPLAHNAEMDSNPKFLNGGGAACSVEVRYCEHGGNEGRFRYSRQGRDMTPYAGELEYLSVRSASLVDGAMVTLYGGFYTDRYLEEETWEFPFHGEEFPAGALSEYALPNGAKAVVYHPFEGADASRPEAWFVYEGVLYYVILSNAPETYAPEGGPDWEAALYKVLDGFRQTR